MSSISESVLASFNKVKDVDIFSLKAYIEPTS